MSQNVSSGDHCIIVQAGRDAILGIKKHPPLIKLVRLEINEDNEVGGTRQKINVILKNNGDTSAFLKRGVFVILGQEEITLCNHIGMSYSLSVTDWTYDVDISKSPCSFTGKHYLTPNEVINFIVMVARESGGHFPTVYQVFLRFEFDEGDDLETAPFHLMISGPTVWQGGFMAQGPTPEQWGKCQADNIRRLDKIGFDFRPMIDASSRKHIEAVAPNIFNRD